MAIIRVYIGTLCPVHPSHAWHMYNCSIQRATMPGLCANNAGILFRHPRVATSVARSSTEMSAYDTVKINNEY